MKFGMVGFRGVIEAECVYVVLDAAGGSHHTLRRFGARIRKSESSHHPSVSILRILFIVRIMMGWLFW